MEDISSLGRLDQEIITRLRGQEKSSLSEADLAVLKARSEYLSEEEKARFFGEVSEQKSALDEETVSPEGKRKRQKSRRK